MKFLTGPSEVKAIGEEGQFEGYASIFGNVDLGGDVIERGAFKEFAHNADGKIVSLWHHRIDSPIGVAEVKQDDKGLRFTGRLVLEDPLARRAQAHMRAGSVRGMSIGYDVMAGGAEILKSGIRVLKALKLWEISVVTFGMNPLAGVDGVKAAGIETPREFETFLRDVGGFSANQAKAIAAAGFRSAMGDSRDVLTLDDVQGKLADVMADYKSLI